METIKIGSDFRQEWYQSQNLNGFVPKMTHQLHLWLVAPEPALVAQGPKQKASEWSCHSCPYPRGSNWHWELGRRWREVRCAASASQDGWYTPNIFKNLKINMLDWTQILKKYSLSNGMLEGIFQLETQIHPPSWQILSPGAVVLCKGRYYEALVWEPSWSGELEGWAQPHLYVKLWNAVKVAANSCWG